MPECKNDKKRKYKGTEPSPKGLGYCAHAEKIGTKKKGRDKNTWIVIENKNGIKRWVKFNPETKYITKKASKDKKVSKKTNHTWKEIKPLKIIKKESKYEFSLEMFFDLTVIPPKNINKYIYKNPIFKKIIDKIMPEIISNQINFFMIPLPLSNNNIYWTDYANSYLTKFYGENYDKDEFIQMTIYLNNDLSINFNKKILISYELDIKKQQIVYNIFSKYLPYNYVWKGNQLEVMIIEYKKRSKKAPKRKIKQIDYYPQIIMYIYIDINKKQNKSFFDTKTPILAKELQDLKKIKSNFDDISYGMGDLNIIHYGIKNINKTKKILEKIKKQKTLTFKDFSFKIRKMNLYLYPDNNTSIKI
mgnify:CR=1 FL=1